VPEPAPVPVADVVTAPGPISVRPELFTNRVDPPADILARVEGCAVIAISARGVSAAGCPGVGVVTIRIPADASSMKGTVIIDPNAPFRPGGVAATEGAPVATTASTASAQEAARPPRARERRQAIDPARATADEKADKKKQRKRDRKKGKKR
jgi:hypothetical protein